MPNTDRLADFIAQCHCHITGDEQGQAQTFRDRLFHESNPTMWRLARLNLTNCKSN